MNERDLWKWMEKLKQKLPGYVGLRFRDFLEWNNKRKINGISLNGLKNDFVCVCILAGLADHKIDAIYDIFRPF